MFDLLKLSEMFSEQAQSWKDYDLDYFRDLESFRNFKPFIEYYSQQIDLGRNPNQIALDFPPITLSVDSNNQKCLMDGRHRYVTAHIFDVTKMPAKLIVYDEGYNLKKEIFFMFPISGKLDLAEQIKKKYQL